MLNRLFFSFMIILFFSQVTWSEEASISINQKIGQMLLVGFRGYTLDGAPELKRAIADGLVGGVVLFDYDVQLQQRGRNIRSPRQLRKLTQELQEASPVPLLIAVDQEGGRVSRLNEHNGFDRGDSPKKLGEIAEEKYLRSAFDTLAQQLADSGINLNLAPGVDLCSNPDNPVIARLGRCFGNAPGKVASLASMFILAHQQRNILTALKHFPGHGSSQNDSHLGFVDISDSWSALELEPYKQLIAEKKADMIMVAHVFNRKIDPENPASLSEKTIVDLLQGEMGFGGIVISDDLQMGALRKYYPDGDILLRAINAGNDILILGNNLDYQPDLIRNSIETIKLLIADGKISRARIAASYKKIMALKSRLPR